MLFNTPIELKAGALEALKPQGTAVPFDQAEPLLAECEHFLECVRNRRTPRTPGEEGVQVLQVLQACQRSLQMNGEPVQLNETASKILVM